METKRSELAARLQDLEAALAAVSDEKRSLAAHEETVAAREQELSDSQAALAALQAEYMREAEDLVAKTAAADDRSAEVPLPSLRMLACLCRLSLTRPSSLVPRVATLPPVYTSTHPPPPPSPAFAA